MLSRSSRPPANDQDDVSSKLPEKPVDTLIASRDRSGLLSEEAYGGPRKDRG